MICARRGEILFCLFLFMTFMYLALASQARGGELYHWVDKDGEVHISDAPPDASVDAGGVKSVHAPEEPAAPPEKKSVYQPPPAPRQKEVVIYTNQT